MATYTTFDLTIDGVHFRLIDGVLSYTSPYSAEEDRLYTPEDTCVLRVEAGGDDAIDALAEAGFQFDDCRPTAR
ncbi:MAG: hypothetical protein KGL35_13885 [Bradyrhizobium sp.]|nr:hypothetical protein [Bradyrhizobium sp.]